MLTQLLGALLKRGPLVRRLWGIDPQPISGVPSTALGVILFFHFILFMVASQMTFMLLGIPPATESGQVANSPFWTFVAIAIGATTTAFVGHAGRVPKGHTPGKRDGPGVEVLADLLLWISVMIMTYFFWGLMYEDIENIRGIGLSLRGIAFLGASSLLFVVFYLPQRYLFLIEDYRSPQTWIQVWAAMLPLAIIVIFG